MLAPILSITVQSELDVIASRQRARQIAASCGFGAQDQARIATAVSELARNVFCHASSGWVKFSVSGRLRQQALVISVEDHGPGIGNLEAVLSGQFRSATGSGQGMLNARRLMERWNVDTEVGQGTRIVMSRTFPADAPALDAGAIDRMASQLGALPINVALSEANQQNRELTETLAALHMRQAELLEVSQRLEATNLQIETLNRLLNEKAESLQSADRRKDEFLSILSHELRGPLSAAGMAARILESAPATQERTVHLSQIIGRQVSHMGRLVEDLLDVSRVSRGLVTIAKAPVDLRTVLEAAREQVAGAAEAKSQRLELRFPGKPCMVEGDQTRLVQIATNLLNNSVRYTDKFGAITATVEQRGRAAVMSVSDNGAGLPAHLMPQLFDLYVQGERSTDRSSGGLGLGLALVKSLVEIHGGTVTARSAGLGHGSTFEVSIPLLVAKRAA